MEELELAASKILAETLNGSHSAQPPNSSVTPSTSQAKEGAVKKKTVQNTKNNNSNNPTESLPDQKPSKSKKGNKKSENGKIPNRNKPVWSSSPRQRQARLRNSEQQLCSESSSMFSDISEKMNCSDNLRNSKGSKRASVPNHCQELQQGAASSSANSTPKQNFHTPDRKNSKLRSKTPECPNTANKPQQQQKKFTPKRSTKFEPYIPLFQVQQGLKRGEFIEGALRINPRNYEDAYLNSPDGQMDIYIGGMHNRNRALNGDLVAVQINPKQEWRILCDAIKDYQEKTGESVVEAAAVPVSPPCKVHTPDRLSKSRPMSSNSWGSSASGVRLPDTLEILGVDKLAQQLEELSAAQSAPKRQRSKRKSKSNQQSKDSTSEKTSTTYSQESSEDCLDLKSPIHLQQDPHDNLEIKGNENVSGANGSLNEKSVHATSSASTNNHEMPIPACDMSDIGTFNLTIDQNSLPSNTWETEESAVNILVSPEDLLTIDGNSLLNEETAYHLDETNNSESENDVIIVPPEDLSGDEFTDSASIGSHQSQHLDQVLEDAEFLACQQDADNNNVELDNHYTQNIINQVNSSEFLSLYPAQNSTTLREKSVELECRIQHNQTLPIFSNVEIHSDSVICSGISQLSLAHSSSGENEEGSSLIIEEFHAPDSLGNFNQPRTPSNIVDQSTMESNNKCDSPLPPNTKKSKRRRRKKKQGKQGMQEKKTKLKGHFNEDTSTWTVDEVMKHPEWPRFIQKTGKVVHIFERKHSCIAAGHLKLFPDKNPNRALFSPNDSRVPRIMVPMSDCPQNFFHRHFDYANYLFLAEIKDWNETSTFASGRLIKSLGNSGDVEVQTEGILVENSVDYSEFPDSVLRCLPREEWQIPQKEIENRRDFRQQCIFTIDPATARDMDDAVSCLRLDNGNFEVGVHIADVTYFVEPGTMLDKFASERSTSVYLTQKVVPMLPRLLCDNLWSWTTNQAWLAFSVVWEMSPGGEICNRWIGRTIIKSCSKFSYEHAQSMIENPISDWCASEFPEVYGGFTLSDISRIINDLNFLAVKLREKRFEDGALRLDQVKLQFTLDKESGLPSGYSLYVQRDSNKLIEEFMLLANMTVAEHIFKAFPTLSMLRRHPPPQPKLLQDTVNMCEAMGVIIDASTSGTLQRSIAHYMGDDYMSKARTELLTSIFSKPMNCALYFCTGILEEEPLFQHYALSVPLYTHFTSPIRRYPDIIVHRLLGASLKYNPPPRMSPNEMEICAAHCNDKKYNAKKVSEQSAEMFLAAFIREIGQVSAKAIIVNVLDHAFDCLVLDMGVVKRVYCDKLPLLKKEFKRSHGVSRLNIFWKDPDLVMGLEQVIVVFALVDVVLTVEKESLTIKATLKKPGSL